MPQIYVESRYHLIENAKLEVDIEVHQLCFGSAPTVLSD